MAEDSMRVPKFNGTGFGLWKIRVEKVMKAKGLSPAIKNENDSTVTDKNDALAASIILNSLDDKVGNKVMACDKAHEIWSRLLDIYENTSQFNVGQLLERYYTYRKENNEDMSTHISRVEGLAIQLEQVGQKQSEESIMAKLLYSLPESFNALKEAWVSVAKDDQTRANLISRLMRYDSKSDGANSKSAQDVVLMANRSSNRGADKKDRRKNIKCYNCGQLGHYKNECKSEQQSEQKPNSGQVTGKRIALIVQDDSSRRDVWVLDSGSSNHICCRREWFTEFQSHAKELIVGNEAAVKAIGIGKIVLECQVGNRQEKIELQDVLFIPEMSYNLFSTSQAVKRGAVVTIDKNGCRIFAGNRVIIQGNIDKSLNVCILRAKTEKAVALLVTMKRSLSDWHEAFGHADPEMINQMAKMNAVDGLELIKEETLSCANCSVAKGVRASHNMSPSWRASKVGQQVDLDLVGPFSIDSVGNHKYLMIARDSYSKYGYVVALRSKDEVAVRLQEYIAQFEVESGQRIQSFRLDNGSEFMNEKVRTMCAVEHIILHTSAPYTPAQNGGAERNNRIILDTLRTMIAESGLPKCLWSEAAVTAAYVRNRILKKGEKETPYEKFKGRKPFVGHLVPFGLPVQALINDRRLGKLDPRTDNAFIVGFTDRSNTYKVYVPSSNKIKISSDIIFRSHSTQRHAVTSEGERPRPEGDVVVTTRTKEDLVPNRQVMDEYFERLVAKGGQHSCASISSHNEIASMHTANEDLTESKSDITSPTFSTITTIAPDNFESTRIGDDPNGSNIGIIGTCSPNEDRQVVLNCTQAIEISIPSCYRQAMNCQESQQWQAAIEREFEAHKVNQTWSIVDRPTNGNVLSTRWVFALKRSPNGGIDSYKGRLVVRGFEQIEGIDFMDTFSPVARNESIRVLLAIAAARGDTIKRFDVSTAFLNGKIQEDVFIEIPEGLSVDRNFKCLKLNKALYGLRQAPRVWNSTFDETAKELGFKPTKTDPCIYYHAAKKILMAVYVDDGLLIANDEQKCSDIITGLNRRFEVKTLEDDLFLGIKITRSRDGRHLHLSQERYVDDILFRFKMTDCEVETCPMSDTKILFNADSPPASCPYRAAVGCLMYLAQISRPDILFAVKTLSKFNENPKVCHWNAVKKVMKYLKGTKNYGLLFQRSHNKFVINAFSDADLGGCLDSRKSTSGVIITFSKSPIVFLSRQQGSVALSTQEAEYIAAAEATKELLWLTMLLGELEVEFEQPTLFVDNSPAVALIANHDSSKKAKHVDIKYHFIRENFKKGLFAVKHVRSRRQQADFLTKALPGKHVEEQCMLSNITPVWRLNTCGDVMFEEADREREGVLEAVNGNGTPTSAESSDAGVTR